MKRERTQLSDSYEDIGELEREDWIASRMSIKHMLKLLYKLNLWDTDHSNDAYPLARKIANELFGYTSSI